MFYPKKKRKLSNANLSSPFMVSLISFFCINDTLPEKWRKVNITSFSFLCRKEHIGYKLLNNIFFNFERKGEKKMFLLF